MPGSVFATGRSSSSDFPTTPGAFYGGLSAQNDSILVRLRTSTGQLQFATFVSGTQARYADWHNDAATGVFADTSGNVYVTGYTIGDRLPVTRTASQAKRKDNTEAFVLRMFWSLEANLSRLLLHGLVKIATNKAARFNGNFCRQRQSAAICTRAFLACNLLKIQAL